MQSALEADGYEVVRSAFTFGIAAVHGIRVTGDGRLDGGADPGHDGVAIGGAVSRVIDVERLWRGWMRSPFHAFLAMELERWDQEGG